ncbi:MAG: MlaD family protein [Bacteroidota bacterium]|nr:MlaD family protein [Bacteroidota bacterium]
MSEPGSKRGIYVGIFIIVGLIFLVGGVLTIGNLHSTFQKKMTITTIFGDVNGLQAGNNIWFSGVKIGTVKKIEFYGKSQVKVIMNIEIEDKQYIRKDAKVKISTDGLIGNKILVIYGGTNAAPEVEEGDLIENEPQLSTETMMETLQKNNMNILKLTEKLANGEGTIGKLLNNDSIYNSIAATTNSLQVASANAQVLINSLAQFTAKLNQDGTLANELVTDTVVFNSMKNSMLQLQQVADTAAAFVSNLKAASENPKTPVGVMLHDEQAGASLKASIVNLETSSKKLDQDLEALQSSILLRKGIKKQKKEAEKKK